MEGNILANKSAKDRSVTDFYPTPENVTIALMDYLQLPINTRIWEPACGEGHMSEAIQKCGYPVISTDLHKGLYGLGGKDFLTTELPKNCDWIITNPPFYLAEQFIKRCIEHKLPFAMLLKSQYWHSAKRRKLFENYKPKAVLPLTWRPDFLFGKKGGSPTMECIWTVWSGCADENTIYLPLKKPLVNVG